MKWQFWKWLFCGLNAKPGYRKIINCWLLAHAVIGIGMAFVVNVPAHEAAQIVLLPLAGMLIGLSFAWVGNAIALLQSNEIKRMMEFHSDGIQNYVYTFQLAILIILTTLVAWGIAGLKVFDIDFFQQQCPKLALNSVLYFLASITLRECWHVVMGSQILILARHNIQEIDKQD